MIFALLVLIQMLGFTSYFAYTEKCYYFQKSLYFDRKVTECISELRKISSEDGV